MPGIEPAWTNVNETINSFSEANAREHIDSVLNHYKKVCSSNGILEQIPNLNDVSATCAKKNCLVRFRGFVQDMFDPEYYLAKYRVINHSTGTSRIESGIFTDVTSCNADEVVDQESHQNQALDRQTLYLVSVPGENSWVTHASRQGAFQPQPSTSRGQLERNKRPADDDVADVMDHDGQPDGAGSKRQCVTSLSDGHTKVYCNEDSFRLNEVHDFVGILGTPCEAERIPDAFGDMPASSVTSSLPRIHLLYSKRLSHINPLLPADISSVTTATQHVLDKAKDVRDKLLHLLTQALLGDRVGAEYLLYHLLARVYGRFDSMALGKFALNLTNCPRTLAPRLYSLLKHLLCKSHCLDLSVGELNSARLVPSKDYGANRLRSGQLQLAADTQLVLDETRMEAGQLEAAGVQNITALGNVIQWQKVEYDFCYHKQSFETNISVLILSESRSLIKCDCLMPLITQSTVDQEEAYKVVEDELKDDILSQIRAYVTFMRHLGYSIGDDLQQEVQNDFAEARKDNPDAMTTGDFHSLLNLARLISISLGQSQLSRESWNRARTLENLRKQRVEQMSNHVAQTA